MGGVENVVVWVRGFMGEGMRLPTRGDFITISRRQVMAEVNGSDIMSGDYKWE